MKKGLDQLVAYHSLEYKSSLTSLLVTVYSLMIALNSLGILLTQKKDCSEKGFVQKVNYHIFANIPVGYFTMLKDCTGCPSIKITVIISC
jgi:hypothetical protein